MDQQQPVDRRAPCRRGLQMQVLALLLLAYIFNFLDRQILGILAVPIKADLELTDAEFGVIGGIAFALLYSVLGVPLACLPTAPAEAGSSPVRSQCGAASPPCAARRPASGQLFLFRLGVGVGEAGGVAPSYALIADYFPPAAAGPRAGHIFARHSARPRPAAR